MLNSFSLFPDLVLGKLVVFYSSLRLALVENVLEPGVVGEALLEGDD